MAGRVPRAAVEGRGACGSPGVPRAWWPAAASAEGSLLFPPSRSACLQVPLGAGSCTAGLRGLQPDDYNSSETDGNSSDYFDEYLCPESVSHPFRRVLVPFVHLLIFLLGGLGNLLVIVILWRYRRSRTSTELFLFHLALANLLLVLTFPFGAVEILVGWVFGTFLCKALSAANRVNFYSSSLLLSCISVDRYLAVVYALQTFQKRRALSVHLACLAIWLLSLLLTMPDLLFTEVWAVGDNLSMCYFKEYGAGGANAHLATRFLNHIVGFFLPSGVMCYCYAAIVRVLCRSQRLQRQKAVKVAILVTSVFLLCWTPYNVAVFLDTLSKLEARGCAVEDGLSIAITVTELVAFSHCCLNPLLYAFVGIRFRHDACRLLHDLGCLSQSTLQEILGTCRTESTTETNVTATRHSTSPCAMNPFPTPSGLPGPSSPPPALNGQRAQRRSMGLSLGQGRD
ncbi:C-X-C chemokine receptor type 5 [Elgaria multicarinata webbii]|uniref:C-X-C chemokine receptor type 5 n=1 Tax=Elgaria multicarinata webbii TaxID=159646 RepID=UPI002FCD2658